MSTPNESEPLPEIKKGISIKVFGVGGAGCNAVAGIVPEEFPGVEFFAVNTDSQALEQLRVPNGFVLGAKRTRGLGAGGDPEMGQSAALEDAENMKGCCAGADMVFILAGLGGGTGTGASPVLARAARESGALVLAIVTLPFEFEGTRRSVQAQAGLQQLKMAADAVICLPNQKLFKLWDEKTSVLDGFKISNGFLSEGLRGVWRLLTQPGLINVDFADLCAVTRGRHAVSSFAIAEAEGEDRGGRIVEQLMAHPLLDGGQVLSEADAVLASVVGGPDLTMSEVNKIMEQLNRHCENAQVTFGAVIDETFFGRVSVTLIASRRHSQESSSSTPREAGGSPLQLLDPDASDRPASRFAPPAPELTEERKEQILGRQGGRSRKKSSRLQKELPLEIVFKGRFEKSEPTIRHGEDLDVPTYIRRGVALN